MEPDRLREGLLALQGKGLSNEQIAAAFGKARAGTVSDWLRAAQNGREVKVTAEAFESVLARLTKRGGGGQDPRQVAAAALARVARDAQSLLATVDRARAELGLTPRAVGRHVPGAAGALDARSRRKGRGDAGDEASGG